MRARSGFGVILDREDRQGLVAKAGDRVVVEVDVRDLNIGRQRIGVDGEAVVVRRDLDLTGG